MKRPVILGVLLVLFVGAGALIWSLRLPVIQIAHIADVYGRRTEDLTANVVGQHHPLARLVKWRLNSSPARNVRQGWPRAQWPEFVIEIPPQRLKPGDNILEIEAADWMGRSERLVRSFVYKPDRPQLPMKIDWSRQSLDVQDGNWETLQRDGVAVVRPRPSRESYDRITLATGAFPIDRRIETSLIFRQHILDRIDKGAREFGFGILSLWGGHPGSVDSSMPRRGWKFSLAWYWSKPGGVGNEISFRSGESEPAWVGSYRSLNLISDVQYRVVIEVRQRDDPQGQVYIEQRLKWWQASEEIPAVWLVTEDREGALLPDGEYAIGLLAFNCQVEFGPMQINPL